MSRDPFYRSREWRALRAARLALDGHRCVVPGCGRPAKVVDHVIPRRQGGADTIDNTRSLCADHDNQVKERGDGTRRGDGRLRAKGCDATGAPLDPGHWWNR